MTNGAVGFPQEGTIWIKYHVHLSSTKNVHMMRKEPIVYGSPNQVVDKRQCTLQLYISPEDEQHVPPAIIFRGKGNVSKIEKDADDKQVHVYWQKNAWMDRSVALNCLKQTFAPAVDKSSENFLFLDNLGCQMTEEFQATFRELASTVVYPLPPEGTDKCQPIDQGEGFLMKKLMGKGLDKHLKESDNVEK